MPESGYRKICLATLLSAETSQMPCDDKQDPKTSKEGTREADTDDRGASAHVEAVTCVPASQALTRSCLILPHAVVVTQA